MQLNKKLNLWEVFKSRFDRSLFFLFQIVGEYLGICIYKMLISIW